MQACGYARLAYLGPVIQGGLGFRAHEVRQAGLGPVVNGGLGFRAHEVRVM